MDTFAVIDIETTGLSTSHHHRVIEIGIVAVNRRGEEIESWSSLINPCRDVGAQDVHGISEADLINAPVFSDIAADVVSLLQDRVPVAHNLWFDANFLAAEFARIGVHTPLSGKFGLCTMQLAKTYLRNSSRNLAACCSAIGFDLKNVHFALEDAKAASLLLVHYLKSDPDFFNRWHERIAIVQNSIWPDVVQRSPKAKPLPRAHKHKEKKVHFLERLVSRLPREDLPPEADSYMLLLDRALIDRFISLHEESELIQVATMLGLSKEQVTECHRNYLRALVSAARAEGELTSSNLKDLLTVGRLLGMSVHEVEAALNASELECAKLPLINLNFSLQPGDRIVFTGEHQDRSAFEALASHGGLIVSPAVSKKTRLVIAADPDSLSGKARRARELGIPVVGYDSLQRLLNNPACG